MPSANELLSGYIIKKQYTEALELIQSNPSDLNLNEINKLGKSYLMSLLYAPNQQHTHFLALVQAIIQSDKFTIGAQQIHPKTNENAFAVAIPSANLGLIKLLLTYSHKLDIIFSGSKLQYTIAQDTLKSRRGSLSTPEYADRARAEIPALEQINAMIRDFTIRHAIATDNSDIMQALEAAGGKPAHALSDDSYPIELTQKGSRIQAWLQELGSRSISALSTNINGFSKVLAEQNAAAVEYNKGVAAIYERGLDRLNDVTKRMANA